MHTPQADVRAFHQKFGHPHPDTPTRFTGEPGPPGESWQGLLEFRLSLLDEEIYELYEELRPYLYEDGPRPSLPNLAAEIVDVLYVTYGLAVSLGVDLEPVWDAIHGANMSKIPNGQEKPTKPPEWEPPRIAPLIEAQQKGTQ